MTTTETTDTFTAASNLTETKANAFLGLYVPVPLKNKVSKAAKAQRRSMSSFAVGVFEEYFNKPETVQ